ncbi:hypothetical protein FIC87_12635 [Eggerthella lenta]|uniref:Antirepressor protein ant N-terminal domain-containing protein n=1 Tax=Eggerthella lenta TaxID=84112 RepID=A0A5C5BRH0_EGGLN|nr:phage antirepressor N-terminal domain-containing protein [Eggerthella lenta]TNU89040.1 hypothetical protein FIC87_12635 [Eggerthella lenta]
MADSSSNQQEIVQVPFNGQTISAHDDGEGNYTVALKPLCENVGIAFNGQYERLSRQPWAVIRMMRTTGSDGKTYQMVMIDRQTMIMWLATIDTSRLKSDQARAVVTAYQKECAKALDDYFFKGVAVNRGDFETVAKALLIVKDELDQKTALVETLEMQSECQDRFIDKLRPKALLAEAVVEPSDATYTVTEATRYLANIVPGVKRQDVFDILRATGMMCKGSTAPTRAGIDTGRMVALAGEYRDKDTGEVRAGRQRGKITCKGLAFLTEHVAGKVA